jgi:SOS-response transcriptional repressor LexA
MKKQPASEVLAQNVKTLLDTHPTINTQVKLAAKSQVGQSSISRVLRAETQATTDTIDALAQAFGITAAQLMTPSSGASNIFPAAVGTRQIPLISYVQAGGWTEAVDSFQPGDGSDWLLTDLELSENAFALEIKGESMLKEFQPGDRVIIDPAVQPNPGDFVVAKNGEHEATFKKYRPRGANERGEQVIELVPLNEDFPSVRSDISPFHIIGTMVEHRRYRKK